MLTPGRKLDRRLTVLRAGAPVDDGFNARPGALVPIATVWASAEHVSDGERARAAERAATATLRFVVRWSELLASVDERDALEYRGAQLDVVAVKEVGRREQLEISATGRAEKA